MELELKFHLQYLMFLEAERHVGNEDCLPDPLLMNDAHAVPSHWFLSYFGSVSPDRPSGWEASMYLICNTQILRLAPGFQTTVVEVLPRICGTPY